uniref:Putative rhoa gtpase effector dia/diaphanous n=1 Tax=Ixodes ricinus TaxID=34613 RepID=A0A0K8R4T5_IXORI
MDEELRLLPPVAQGHHFLVCRHQGLQGAKDGRRVIVHLLQAAPILLARPGHEDLLAEGRSVDVLDHPSPLQAAPAWWVAWTSGCWNLWAAAPSCSAPHSHWLPLS